MPVCCTSSWFWSSLWLHTAPHKEKFQLFPFSVQRQRNESRKKKKKPSIFLFLNKTILKFSRLLKTSDNYLEEKVIITSQRDGPKPFCCNCMVGKSVLFTSGGSSIYLQPDRIWIPNLVTYQMMTHHFIQTFYGREKHVWGKPRWCGKRKDRKIK